jgi:hypothetical protein
MTGTKVLLIVLILIVVLFVVCVVWGVLNDKKPSYPPRSKLGDLFGSLSPKLKPMELTPDPPPPRRSNVPPAKFIVKTGDQPTTFDVSPDSHHKVRRATFSATTPDCASIEYQTLDGSGADLKLNKQYWPKGPDGSTRDTDHPTKVTFQILSAQGRLTIAFPQPFVPCVVQLE